MTNEAKASVPEWAKENIQKLRDGLGFVDDRFSHTEAIARAHFAARPAASMGQERDEASAAIRQLGDAP